MNPNDYQKKRYERIIELREKGYTFKEITREFCIGRGGCSKLLKEALCFKYRLRNLN